MNNVISKENVLLEIANNYHIEEIKDGLDSNELSNVYLWAMLKEYNYFKINPKLYTSKGAFANLGYPLEIKDKIIKRQETIDDNRILIDIVKAYPSCEAICHNNGISSYIGILIFKKEVSLDDIYLKIEPLIRNYFVSDYETFSKTHMEIIVAYFNQMMDMDCDILIPGSSLKGERKFFRISKGCNHFQFNKTDLIDLPFSKPYSDYVNWSIKWDKF